MTLLTRRLVSLKELARRDIEHVAEDLQCLHAHALNVAARLNQVVRVGHGDARPARLGQPVGRPYVRAPLHQFGESQSHVHDTSKLHTLADIGNSGHTLACTTDKRYIVEEVITRAMRRPPCQKRNDTMDNGA